MRRFFTQTFRCSCFCPNKCVISLIMAKNLLREVTEDQNLVSSSLNPQSKMRNSHKTSCSGGLSLKDRTYRDDRFTQSGYYLAIFDLMKALAERSGLTSECLHLSKLTDESCCCRSCSRSPGTKVTSCFFHR